MCEDDDDEAPDCDHEWNADSEYQGCRSGRDKVWWECSLYGEQTDEDQDPYEPPEPLEPEVCGIYEPWD